MIVATRPHCIAGLTTRSVCLPELPLLPLFIQAGYTIYS
jgi:hypothetical protein